MQLEMTRQIWLFTQLRTDFINQEALCGKDQINADGNLLYILNLILIHL